MRHKYNLGFVTDEALYDHVKSTVQNYRLNINLNEFNKNIVDPIKMTFDAKVFNRPYEHIIQDECMRQIDKSNNNTIGYFHQNFFRLAPEGWEVPTAGFDVQNHERHIYVEMKKKHNTMNAASSKNTYIKMQQKILEDDKAVCMLVEVIAKKSQNDKWKIMLDGRNMGHERIRRVSIDKFYGIVFGDDRAFAKLCAVLPLVLDDVLSEISIDSSGNTVFNELRELSPDILRSLYLLAFKTYDGFDEF